MSPGIKLALVACLALTACAKKTPPPEPKLEIGAECRVRYQCISSACADRACASSPRQSGESCGMHATCAEGLTCYLSTMGDRLTSQDEDFEPSVTYGDTCRTPEEIAMLDRERKSAAARALLEQSGVENDRVEKELGAAETEPAGAGAGLSVRVVRTETTIETTKGTGFAACRRDERLIGGSCSTSYPESGPGNYGKIDTVGARWTCAGTRREKVIAIALCQKLPLE